MPTAYARLHSIAQMEHHITYKMPYAWRLPEADGTKFLQLKNIESSPIAIFSSSMLLLNETGCWLADAAIQQCGFEASITNAAVKLFSVLIEDIKLVVLKNMSATEQVIYNRFSPLHSLISSISFSLIVGKERKFSKPSEISKPSKKESGAILNLARWSTIWVTYENDSKGNYSKCRSPLGSFSSICMFMNHSNNRWEVPNCRPLLRVVTVSQWST